MGRPNASNLPQHLRRRPDGAYIFDHPLTLEDGSKIRKIEVLGVIPKAEAIEIWKQKMADIRATRYFKQPVTFEKAADSFLEYSKSRKRSWQKDIQVVSLLKQHFGLLELEDLNGDLVEKFLNKIKTCGPKGNPLKPGTLNRYLACLKTIVNRAMNNGHLDRNPIRGVKLFRENNVRDQTLTAQQYQDLLAGCTDYLRPMVQLAYVTGMRRGEITGLRWDQVDLAEQVIKLSADDTKTNEAREVPLDADLVAMLKTVPRLVGSPYVFHHRRLPVKDIKTAFNAACVRAGLTNFRFHDLRHCAVTNLRKAGVNDGVIMAISGHKTTHMLRRYDKIDRGDKREALDLVRKKYDIPVEPLRKTA